MLRLENVSKSYGSIKVLENLSLKVENCSIVCITGRSGCGKSTLLKVIALIAKPDNGVLMIEGEDISKLNGTAIEMLRKKRIAYSFQEPLLIPYMTALENLTEVIEVRREKAIEMLSLLGLANRINHRPSKLSVGEKKRVDIARAILRESSILVADEPLSNLDPLTGAQVTELLKAHAKGGGTVIYSSVDPAEGKFADHVMTID